MTQILEWADQDFKAAIITMLQEEQTQWKQMEKWGKVSWEIEATRKKEMEILELKIAIMEI